MKAIQPNDQYVTLVMTRDEAITLKRVMAAVGGDPVKTRRKHCDSLWHALTSVGIDYTCESTVSTSGSVYFVLRKSGKPVSEPLE